MAARQPATAPAPEAPLKASPLAKKLAREADVDLAALSGTGPGGRIVRRDVEAAAAGAGRAGAPRRATVPPAVAPVTREDALIQLPRLRQAIARRMTEAKTSVPHFYVSHEYAAGPLLAFRRQLADYLAEEQMPSVNDLIVKASALTLQETPNLNSSFAGDHVVRHGAINIGIAVAVENGLLTVVCRAADLKHISQIAAEVKGLVARARSGKVKPDDIEGSTFSVSNLGMFDVENFAAILNPPEAAILAVGSARQVPVVEAGQIRVGWRMKATISVDHRVSDGAEAARFLQTLGAYLENPARLLL
jgi:pyruvate dehydrogenase E2 component (dihydrolipoamide acetyltransferase)